ncbi:DUF4906 domain-containing protein [Prevotella sp.]|uniref:DUF4906 domain-containing protein n=1 Tax=Prevotella sp. TaxID=59823 RepID=UPI0026484741|nr:fimbrial protein [Prevotella sp.]MDN5554776.1 fimbrial protein [Prevotella sp.]
MNKYHTIYSLSVPAFLLSLCLILASCAGEEFSSTSQNSGDTTTVKLTFCISDGNQTRAITSANENIVSDITVMIFDTSGSLIGSTYQSSVSAGSVSVPVTTRSASNCKIYAIANTGSSSYFAGVNTIDKLNTMYTTIANAADLENNGSTANSTGAMMIGHIDVPTIDPGTNQFAIPLYHQCGKFSFTIIPVSGVTITGYQLCNVPLSSYITDSHVSPSAPPPVETGNYGNFDAVSGLNLPSLSKTYYIYENLCGSNANASSEVLRKSIYAPTSASYLLVNAKGTGWASTYRIYLGGVTNTATPAIDFTNFNVYRNLNYNCTISLGASGGNGDARVTYTATVPDQGVRSGAVIGTATPGDYLYSDGTTGRTLDKTVIGIVFSNQLSSAEYAKGYTHGYVLALKDVSTSTCAYQSSNSDAGLTKVQNFTAYYNDINAGYYGTFALHYDNSNATYPAWQAAYNYIAKDKNGINVALPSGTSGWYLPSAGQWWDICANLGKVDLTGMQNSSSGIGNVYSGSTAIANVNNAISAAGGTPLITNNYYCSASEYDSTDAVYVGFSSSGMMMGHTYKFTQRYARSVLAF